MIKEGENFIGADLRITNLIGHNFKYANLSHADLRYTDLTGADLRYSNLIMADLEGADLAHADLTGANLSGANLRGASLMGANIKNIACGNNREIRTIQLGTYVVVLTRDVMAIGCKQHTIREWMEFSDFTIDKMDIETSLSWWKINKPILKLILAEH